MKKKGKKQSPSYQMHLKLSGVISNVQKLKNYLAVIKEDYIDKDPLTA